MNNRKKTFIIAEAGVNHNGSLEIAIELIIQAKKAGADAVKFQTFTAENLVSRNAEKAEYQKLTTFSTESQLEMLKKLELKKEDHVKLITACKDNEILFLSSPFDENSADLLDELGVLIYKIPSGEITNHPFLKYVAAKGKPLIVSTGMSTLGEIEEAVDIIYATDNRDISLLHCVTEYPAPYEQINLNAMLTMASAFKLPVGYSDHTRGIEISLAAVAMGARIIEKHFTLDKTMSGPDHKASLEPAELKQMVDSIRNIESSLGDGIKKPAECEKKNIAVARKSICASRNITKGEVFNSTNICVKRPGNGLSPKLFPEVIGKTARNNFKKDELITL